MIKTKKCSIIILKDGRKKEMNIKIYQKFFGHNIVYKECKKEILVG